MADYLNINREAWNNKTETHLNSVFYNVDKFKKGKTSLNPIELELLDDIKGKSILHLQCHFGQDSMSLSRMGAKVTGIDFSDKAISIAKKLSKELKLDTSFICSDVYDLPQHLEGKFDIVYTSYGVIGWLPDLDKWAKVISHFLKPKGQLIFVEFHPFVWMFDEDFKYVKYKYFKSNPIIEKETGTYADKKSSISQDIITWNHSLSEVCTSLISNGLFISTFNEYDYSPYDCFKHTIALEQGKYRIEHLNDYVPMLYATTAIKP